MSSSELSDFRLFAKRLALFSLPLVIYLAVVVSCDPFEFLGWSGIVSESVKLRSASPLNPCLWKMAKFRHNPAPNILLGDSRMGEVPAKLTSDITHEPYANLAYGAASLKECIETFWFANRTTKLSKVYFGVDFDMYNDYQFLDRTQFYRDVAGNPLLYLLNRTVLKATAYTIYSAAMNKDLQLGAPGMTREELWNYKVNGEPTRRLFKNYLYPVKYRAQLMEVGQYAAQHGIQLTFVIFPTHTDYQARFVAFGLEGQKRQFYRDLASIATVVDFDYPNAFTSNEANFADPLHLTAAAVDKVAAEIWGNRTMYARRF